MCRAKTSTSDAQLSYTAPYSAKRLFRFSTTCFTYSGYPLKLPYSPQPGSPLALSSQLKRPNLEQQINFLLNSEGVRGLDGKMFKVIEAGTV